jgi:serine/threonine-protein kinase RsbW
MAGHHGEETAGHTDDAAHNVFRCASTHDNVETLTDRVCELLRDVPMQEKAKFRLKLAIHEALSNAVEHGNHNDPSRQVTVTCRRLPGHVAIIIDDEGDGFDPTCVPDPTEPENLLKEGGRGIYLMRHYADECRFENNGRRIVLVKRLS